MKPHVVKPRARTIQQKVWIEVYFDPELDGRWHITQWQYGGRFDPMTARHKTLDKSYAGIREARDAGTVLRRRWLTKRNAAKQRRYLPQDVQLTVTPKCDDLARAVLRRNEGEETGHEAQGIHPMEPQHRPECRTSGLNVRLARKGNLN